MKRPHKIKKLFDKLIQQPINYFPLPRTKWDMTNQHGVYVIYSPENKVLHVGKSSRGENGLRQRLYNHLHGASSFSQQYLSIRMVNLRERYYFKFILVSDAKDRAYLENLTSGMLCPEHIGTSEKKAD